MVSTHSIPMQFLEHDYALDDDAGLWGNFHKSQGLRGMAGCREADDFYRNAGP